METVTRMVNRFPPADICFYLKVNIENVMAWLETGPHMLLCLECRVLLMVLVAGIGATLVFGPVKVGILQLPTQRGPHMGAKPSLDDNLEILHGMPSWLRKNRGALLDTLSVPLKSVPLKMLKPLASW